VSHQSVIFAVWLGIAVFAVVAANLYQWHSRRLLRAAGLPARVQHVRHPANVPELSHSVSVR